MVKLRTFALNLRSPSTGDSIVVPQRCPFGQRLSGGDYGIQYFHVLCLRQVEKGAWVLVDEPVLDALRGMLSASCVAVPMEGSGNTQGSNRSQMTIRTLSNQTQARVVVDRKLILLRSMPYASSSCRYSFAALLSIPPLFFWFATPTNAMRRYAFHGTFSTTSCVGPRPRRANSTSY